MSSISGIHNSQTAFQALSTAATNVNNLTATRDRLAEQLETADEKLQRAQEYFNAVREEALKYFPALATGFPVKTETVGIGDDGKVHVVEEK